MPGNKNILQIQYSIQINKITYKLTKTSVLYKECDSVYGSEAGDCGRANLEAGGWQVIYSVRYTYTYTTCGQVHKARQLLTWQHSTSPLAAYLQKKTRFFFLRVHIMLDETVS